MKLLGLAGLLALAACDSVAMPDPRSADPYERYLGALQISDERDIADVRYLYSMMDDPDPLARDGAVLALGEIPVDEHVGLLKEALTAGTGPYAANTTIVRSDACRSLARLGGRDAISALLRALEWDEAADVRRTAALALASLPIGRAELPVLIKAVGDPSAGVSFCAVRTLEGVTGIRNIGRNRAGWQSWYDRTSKPVPPPKPSPSPKASPSPKPSPAPSPGPGDKR